jgi:hypothetical protein
MSEQIQIDAITLDIMDEYFEIHDRLGPAAARAAAPEISRRVHQSHGIDLDAPEIFPMEEMP